ncbi:MAG: hypothetical protein LBR26_05385 [Prevotella sp.]|nr:hypothetical protein [Prevotella sp.]
MEVWPINSAARQQEQKKDFPLVIKTSLYPCSGLPRPQIHSIQWLLFRFRNTNGELNNVGNAG